MENDVKASEQYIPHPGCGCCWSEEKQRKNKEILDDLFGMTIGDDGKILDLEKIKIHWRKKL